MNGTSAIKIWIFILLPFKRNLIPEKKFQFTEYADKFKILHSNAVT
jgi:hypothetical protein